MKIKKIQSNQRKLILGISLFSALFFASCSKTLTSMKSSNELQNQQVLAKPLLASSPYMANTYHKEKGIDISSDQPFQLSMQPISISSPAINQKLHKNIFAYAKSHEFIHHSTIVKNLVINKISHQVASIKPFPKNNVVMSAKNTAQPEYNMIWTGFYFLIISLVFFILGLLPVIGIVFWYIAVIFLVVGLLFLLLGLLRMAA